MGDTCEIVTVLRNGTEVDINKSDLTDKDVLADKDAEKKRKAKKKDKK